MPPLVLGFKSCEIPAFHVFTVLTRILTACWFYMTISLPERFSFIHKKTVFQLKSLSFQEIFTFEKKIKWSNKYWAWWNQRDVHPLYEFGQRNSDIWGLNKFQNWVRILALAQIQIVIFLGQNSRVIFRENVLTIRYCKGKYGIANVKYNKWAVRCHLHVEEWVRLLKSEILELLTFKIGIHN